MTELIDRGDSLFAKAIEAVGPFPDNYFSRIAYDELAREPTKPRQCLITAGIMARGGCFVCEKWDPLYYQTFLVCVGDRVLKEADRIGARLTRSYLPHRHQVKTLGFVAGADSLLRDGWEARPVAWTLMREGLHLCYVLEPEYYDVLLGGMAEFLKKEMERTEHWPRFDKF